MPIYKLVEGSIQHRYHLCRKKIQIFGGGFGNGKTTAMVAKAIQLVRDYPGCNGLLARESFPKLNDTLRKEFFKWCPPGVIKRMPTKDDNTCYFKNGSVLNFRYLSQRGKSQEGGDTTSNLLSATYDFIGIDQVEDPGITYKDFLDMLGRLRGNTTYRPAEGTEDLSMPRSGPRWLLLSANPTHNWFYKQIIMPYLIWRDQGIRMDGLIVDPDTLEPMLELFEGSTYTNEANLEKDFLKGLEASYKGQMRQRYLLGEWAAFEGLVYPSYNEKIHMIPQEQALDYLREQNVTSHVRVRACEGYDFGIVVPSCYTLGGIDGSGRVIDFAGFYRPDTTVDKQVQLIREIRSEFSSLVEFDDPIFADPAIFKRVVVAGQHVDRMTIAKLFKEQGVNMKPGSNDRLNGISKVSMYLAENKDLPNPFNEDAASSPMFFHTANLDFYHSEFSNFFWKKNPQGQHIDEPIDKDDHAMDQLKYKISKLPDPSDIAVPRHLQIPEYMFWQEERV